jgi:hypothetical protein
MANMKLLRETLEFIKSIPEREAGDELIGDFWSQGTWGRMNKKDDGEHPCGTAACFAGWAVLRDVRQKNANKIGKNGTPIVELKDCTCLVDGGDPVGIRSGAAELLELSYNEAKALFCGENSLKDLERVINQIQDGYYA